MIMQRLEGVFISNNFLNLYSLESTVIPQCNKEIDYTEHDMIASGRLHVNH